MLAHTSPLFAGELFRPFFDPSFSRPFAGPSAEAFAPRVDILQTEDGIHLLFDAPGVQPSDVEVTMHQGTLTLNMQRTLRYPQGELRHSERSSGRFTRSFQLGDAYDADQVTAKLEDGVLSVHIGRRPEARPRRIPIGVGGSEPNNQLVSEVPSSASTSS